MTKEQLNTRAEQLVAEWQQKLEEAIGVKLGGFTEIRVTRHTRFFGFYDYDVRGTKELWLSSTLLGIPPEYEYLLATLICHELLHTAEGGVGHKGAWLTYANIVNEKFGLHILPTGDMDEVVPHLRLEEIPVPLWRITCRECGSAFLTGKLGDYDFGEGFCYECNQWVALDVEGTKTAYPKRKREA